MLKRLEVADGQAEAEDEDAEAEELRNKLDGVDLGTKYLTFSLSKLLLTFS